MTRHVVSRPSAPRLPGMAGWRRAWLHLLLPLVLLLAQSAGLRHGVLHPHAGGPAPQARALQGAASGEAGHGAAASGAAHHEDGSALCRLIDHLGHADLLPTAAAVAVQVARPPLSPAASPVGATPCTTTVYEARGPPTTALS
ncbi:hypothetical protein [Aquincola sp. J276]|uniref:hypothetical protein n=1 Tax=Aquincola sp. J276 TaxID=2898432 RepID=UPI0021509A7A|nr:hypothetical protein [Aquincola sp. J276]MCR5869008.1 hypothetical protein [Aquincola sp. J276]